MADTRPERRFTRIDRLPPYVFNITAELKMAARRRGEDIIDFSMGNPDGATPPHIVEKLCTVAQRPDTHGYSTSRGIPRLRRAISRWYQDRYDVEIDPESYSAAIFLIPICISFDTAEKRRYATYLILNRRFSFEF